MPQLQVVDLNPLPRTETTPLEKTLSSFANRVNENRKEQRETDALTQIYDEFKQDGDNLTNTLKAIQTRPGISPTTRVNTVNQLLKFQEHNTNLQKTAAANIEKAEKAANQAVIAKDLAEKKGLNAEQAAAYAANPALLEKVYPKEGKGNQADRQVEPEQLDRMEKVESMPEFQNATPSQKHRLYTRGGVSNANADAALKPVIEEEKAKPGAKFAEIREKAVADYVNSALDKREEAESIKFSLDIAKKAVQGDVTGPGILGALKNSPYSQIIIGLSPDESTLQAANKKLLEGTKGIFGSKPTEREIFLLLNTMLPSIGKTKEANLAGIEFIEKITDMELLHSELVNQISEGGTKYVPDLENQVNARMKPLADQLRNQLQEATQKFGDGTKPVNSKIKVTAPDGSKWEMTQEQINAAKAKGVNFEPIK